LSNSVARFNQWENQNIALAAVAQCASLVSSLAVTGSAPQTEVIASINPLLVLDPDSIDDIYPRVADLSMGLRTIQDTFSDDPRKENADIIRYTLGLLLLRNKLTSNQQMQTAIRLELQEIDPIIQATDSDGSDEEENNFTQERLFEQLAKLYQDTISTLSYRIQVQGKVENLKNEQVANRIRALLLAGIRSAVLWYQLGGRRWRLVFYRKRVHETAGNIRRKLLTSI
jgi:high frequency lysogenization protein